METTVQNAMKHSPIASIIGDLDSNRGNRGKSPPSAIVVKYAKQLRSEDRDLEQDFRDLLGRGSLATLKLALSLVPTSTKLQPDYREVLALADNPNWEIREYAAEALSAIVKQHFDAALREIKKLRSHPSENIRRAVVVAMKYLAKDRDPQRLPTIIEVLEQYMDDASPYVRKNLGPFALGDALIEYAPTEVLQLIRGAAKSSNPISRWNSAAVFTAATASKYYPQAKSMLVTLLRDPDRAVRAAALSALSKIARRHPEWRSQIGKAVNRSELGDLHSKSSLHRAKEACDE